VADSQNKSHIDIVQEVEEDGVASNEIHLYRVIQKWEHDSPIQSHQDIVPEQFQEEEVIASNSQADHERNSQQEYSEFLEDW
jgi:hypothetical protein